MWKDERNSCFLKVEKEIDETIEIVGKSMLKKGRIFFS
jgi:hypothetical protein